MTKVMTVLLISVLTLSLFSGCGSSSDAQSLLKEAETLFRQRKIKEGAEKIKEAYGKDPENMKIITAYAQVQLYTGKTNQALAVLDKGLQTLKGEELKQLAGYRAFFLAKAGMRKAALKAVAKGLKRWPGDKGFKFVERKIQTMPGGVAPDFSGQLINGGRVSLKQYRGKVVLMDFWASWCGPCRRSMPHLKELYAKYRGRGLVVLGVNLDKTRSAALGFMKKAGVNFPVLFGSDNQQISSVLYGVRGIPATFLIDKKGIIRYSGHPMGLREGVIKGLL